jgi:hypothetical protein
LKQSNPPLLNQNSQYVLGVISLLELQKVNIANSKPHRLLDSSTLGYHGITFCSPSLGYNGITFFLPDFKKIEKDK